MVTAEIATNGGAPAETFGQRLRRLRVARGWTLLALRAASGVSESALSRYERDIPGQKDAELVRRVAEALGIPADELLSDLSVVYSARQSRVGRAQRSHKTRAKQNGLAWERDASSPEGLYARAEAMDAALALLRAMPASDRAWVLAQVREGE